MFQFVYFFFEKSFKPGKYLVNIRGTTSTLYSSTKSGNKTKFGKDTILELIKIKNITSEHRIRGQIKDSLDWVSIKNTKNGYIWMKPMAQVTHHVTSYKSVK